MAEKILQMFFDIERWTKAIEKGVGKDIRKELPYVWKLNISLIVRINQNTQVRHFVQEKSLTAKLFSNLQPNKKFQIINYLTNLFN